MSKTTAMRRLISSKVQNIDLHYDARNGDYNFEPRCDIESIHRSETTVEGLCDLTNELLDKHFPDWNGDDEGCDGVIELIRNKKNRFTYKIYHTRYYIAEKNSKVRGVIE